MKTTSYITIKNLAFRVISLAVVLFHEFGHYVDIVKVRYSIKSWAYNY